MEKKILAYSIYSDLERFKNLDWKEDALLEPPENQQYGTLFSETEDFNLPATLFFRAFFSTMKGIDFPANDVSWPIMSKRMYDVLLSFGDFPHRAYPCVMVNIEDPGGGEWDGKSIPDPKYCRNDYIAVQLTEYADIFDFERSEYEKGTRINPDRIRVVHKLAVRVPLNGLPHIFRIKEERLNLYIRPEVKSAFEKAGLKGINYMFPLYDE